MLAKQSRKLTTNTKVSEIGNNELSKLTAENFTARLKQGNLSSNNDIANFVKKKIDFDNKLKNVTSNKNELNELSKKVKAISTKVSAKDLIKKFSIFNRRKYIKYFSSTTQIKSCKSNEFQKKIYKI